MTHLQSTPPATAEAPRSQRVAAPRRSRPETLQRQIEVLFGEGLGDAEIARRLGCKTPYVRVARQRAGLYRDRRPGRAARLTEAHLVQRIERLQKELAGAWRELRTLRERESVPASRARPPA